MLPALPSTFEVESFCEGEIVIESHSLIVESHSSIEIESHISIPVESSCIVIDSQIERDTHSELESALQVAAEYLGVAPALQVDVAPDLQGAAESLAPICVAPDLQVVAECLAPICLDSQIPCSMGIPGFIDTDAAYLGGVSTIVPAHTSDIPPGSVVGAVSSTLVYISPSLDSVMADVPADFSGVLHGSMVDGSLAIGDQVVSSLALLHGSLLEVCDLPHDISTVPYVIHAPMALTVAHFHPRIFAR